MSEYPEDTTLLAQLVDLDLSQFSFLEVRRWGLHGQLTSHCESFQLSSVRHSSDCRDLSTILLRYLATALQTRQAEAYRTFVPMRYYCGQC